MMRHVMGWCTVLGLAVLLAACGSDDFQAGSRFKVLQLADKDGSTAPIFFAVEETDDTGADGDAGTDDPGEDDGFPDDGEALLTPLSSDIGSLELENEVRPGVETGVDLEVYLIDVTYYDADGNTPAFAPRYRQNVRATVQPDSTQSLDFTLVPLDMKTAVGGLRDVFLYGTADQVRRASTMTAVVDVYARDTLNDDGVHGRASVTVQFVNPMVAKPAQ